MTATRDSYKAKDITVLEGLEAVKRRPGMYIGSTGPRGLHHLIWEEAWWAEEMEEAQVSFNTGGEPLWPDGWWV